MLQVSPNNRRAQWHWPRPPEGDDTELMNVAAGGFTERYRRGKRRATVGRFALGALLALALCGAGAVAYLAWGGGAFETMLANVSPAPAAETGPATTATAPAPAASPAAARPVAVATARPPIPDVRTMMILIRNTIVSLHQANVTGNYAVLRQIAGPRFQQANSPAALSQAFANLRDRDLDLGQIAGVEPRLKRDPSIDENGLLHLSGLFAVGSDPIDFDLAYQLVNGRWRLFGIGVHPQNAPEATPAEPKAPAGKPKLPDGATMLALIRGAVIALNQANTAGDYAVLRDFGSRGFREANSLAQLTAIFAELRGRQLDLGPVSVIEPQLIREAKIDPRGYLRLTGFFPSRPERVNFDLAFTFEDGLWRLFGIALNTSREEAVASVPAGNDAAGAAASTLPPTPRVRP